MPRKKKAEITEIGGEVPTNAGKTTIQNGKPYIAQVTIEGTAAFLFHRYNPDYVEARNAAPKGSEMKTTDDCEAYVWRNDANEICVPGEYLRQGIIESARSHQDPRSKRKMAMDMVTAGVVALTELASLGKTTWDYEDKRGVGLNNARVTRTRPAFKPGWKVSFDFQVLLPEYISPGLLNQLISETGRLVGIGNFRPTYGRFMLVAFKVS